MKAQIMKYMFSLMMASLDCLVGIGIGHLTFVNHIQGTLSDETWLKVCLFMAAYAVVRALLMMFSVLRTGVRLTSCTVDPTPQRGLPGARPAR